MTATTLRRNLGTDTVLYTGRTACEDGSKDQSDTAETKEYQRLPAHHQKLGNRHTNQNWKNQDKLHMTLIFSVVRNNTVLVSPTKS